MPITHTDGAEYFSQAEIDEIIKTRLRNTGAELAQVKQELENTKRQASAADEHQTRIGELEQQLAQAQGGLSRWKAATAMGIQDEDTVWLLEQAHGRAMSKVEEGKRAEFSDYLASLKSDPSLAPQGLRHLFQASADQPAASAQSSAPPAPQQQQGQAPAAPQQAPAQPGAQPPAPAQPQRPAWASSTAGQLPVAPGSAPSFADRIRGAKTLEDLAALQQERRNGGS